MGLVLTWPRHHWVCAARRVPWFSCCFVMSVLTVCLGVLGLPEGMLQAGQLRRQNCIFLQCLRLAVRDPRQRQGWLLGRPVFLVRTGPHSLYVPPVSLLCARGERILMSLPFLVKTLVLDQSPIL